MNPAPIPHENPASGSKTKWRGNGFPGKVPIHRMKFLFLSLLLTARLLAEDVTVFAAASLTDAMKDIAAAYEKISGDRIVHNFGASSALAQQILAGSPADVFFSADEAKMDLLEQEQLLVPGSRVSLLGNTLVVVTAPDGPSITRLEDLRQPSIKYISLGNPKAVPVGVYAKTYLEKAGLWTALAPKIAPAENVRASLAVVEAGNAEAAIVYKTDAAISRKVKIALEIPAAEGPPIRYPVAIVKDSRHLSAARKFTAYLRSPEALAIFEKYGFLKL
ncbi:MAG: molybdate ABC transporter substrate-binding protein [Luteolibacter sp.]